MFTTQHKLKLKSVVTSFGLIHSIAMQAVKEGNSESKKTTHAPEVNTKFNCTGLRSSSDSGMNCYLSFQGTILRKRSGTISRLCKGFFLLSGVSPQHAQLLTLATYNSEPYRPAQLCH